jgi:hypothetical protein
MGDRHFLIYEHSTCHPMVYLASAGTAVEAMTAYLRERVPKARMEPNGAITLWEGHSEVRYPHPLACIEALWKTAGEWQMRELPAGTYNATLVEAFCGEDPENVAYHLAKCRPLLRQEFPRSRAPGFIWYLTDGVLVTFYRRRRCGRPEVLRRFVRRWDRDVDYLPWDGDHASLTDDLYLGPGPTGILL